MNFLTEKQIIVKVDMAIQLMGSDADNKPTSFRFLGAKKLQKGVAVLVLLTEEAMMRLKQEEKMVNFMENLGGSTSCFPLKKFIVLAMFVPTTFDNSTLVLHDLKCTCLHFVLC